MHPTSKSHGIQSLPEIHLLAVGSHSLVGLFNPHYVFSNLINRRPALLSTGDIWVWTGRRHLVIHWYKKVASHRSWFPNNWVGAYLSRFAAIAPELPSFHTPRSPTSIVALTSSLS